MNNKLKVAEYNPEGRISLTVGKKTPWGYPLYWVIRVGPVIKSMSRYARSLGQVVGSINATRIAANKRGYQFCVWENERR